MNNPAGSSSQNVPVGGASPKGEARCAVHPNVAATFCCNDCNRTFCDTCGFKEGDGDIVCTECMTRRMPPPAAPCLDSDLGPISPELARQMSEKNDQELLAMLSSPDDWTSDALNAGKSEIKKRNLVAPSTDSSPSPAPQPFLMREGVMCKQHPHVKATQQCKRCGGYMCPTCDFSFPGEIHFCPACASKTEDSLSPRRKKFLIWSFVLAAWSTIGMACLVSGALSGLASNKDDTAVLGWILILFVLGPSITGLSLGVTAKSSRVGNPASLWIAITWNAILVASFVVLMLVGLAKQ